MVVIRGNQVSFSFFRPQAGQVYLVGDFNGWRPAATPMSRTPDGHWRVNVALPTGRFRFRYRAGAEWFADHAAGDIEPGPFGDNSVFVIESNR